MRRLDIGIASYGNLDKLKRTVDSIMTRSTTDWRLIIVDNPGPDHAVRSWLQEITHHPEGHRIILIFLPENIGYAGAVNRILETAVTEYIAYCDNDIVINTDGWDEKLCFLLDRFHEVGLVFPNNGCFEIPRDSYSECLWGTGFCWVINRLAMKDTGLFDVAIGHQNEADYALRLRMAGWKCAAASLVSVSHDATATTDPAALERINRGVVDFVNKWNRYFCGKNSNYHSPNVMRWEDWPPNALYLEEYWKLKLPDLNTDPQVITDVGRYYDLIRVPRLKDFYRGRII